MKQFAGFLSLFMITNFNTAAQADRKTTLAARNGSFTVSKTNEGRDMMMLNSRAWDETMGKTKYCFADLPVSVTRKFCIKIADKKYGFCRQGIGFGCGIFDFPSGPCTFPNRVNNENRICAVRVKKIKGAVQIVFMDKVDWVSLQKNIPGRDY